MLLSHTGLGLRPASFLLFYLSLNGCCCFAAANNLTSSTTSSPATTVLPTITTTDVFKGKSKFLFFTILIRNYLMDPDPPARNPR